MASNLQYILRPDSSTPYTRVSSAFRKNLDKIAARKKQEKKRPIATDYVHYYPSSLPISQSLQHGDWYKPSRRSLQKELDAIEDYDSNNRIQEFFKRQREEKNKEAADIFAKALKDLKEKESLKAEEESEQIRNWYDLKNQYEDELNKKFGDNSVRKTLYRLSDIIGNFANNSSEGGIQESQGRIALAKTDKELADAYLYVQEIATLKAYENQDFVDGSVDYDELYKRITEKYNNYKLSGYNESDIADMARAYEKKFTSSKYDTTDSRFSLVNESEKRKLNIEKRKLLKQLGIDPDFDYTKTLSLKIEEINQYKKDRDQDIKDEEESLYGKPQYGILPNKMQRKQFWNGFWNVSLKGKQLGLQGGNLKWNDLNYFIWGQSAQMGYSYSSGAGIVSGAGHTAVLGASVAAATATAEFGGVGGAVVNNVGNALLSPLDYQSGVGENYQEAAQRYGDNLLANLQLQFKGKDLSKMPSVIALQNEAIKKAKASGLSDKEAKELYDVSNSMGLNNVLLMFGNGAIQSNDIRLNKAKIGATKGLKQQFMADNVRTMGATAAQYLVSTVDITGAAGRYGMGLASKIGGTAVGRKIASSAAGKVVSKGVNSIKNVVSDVKGYQNSFIGKAVDRGVEVGADVSDVLGGGILGRGIGKVVGGTVGGAIKATKDAVLEAIPDGTKAGLANFLGATFNKTAALAEMFGTKLLKREALKQMVKHRTATDVLKYLGKYGYASARAGVVDHFSEGNEELAQYINSKEDFAKTYGYDSGNLAELLWNDFKLGGLIAKFYAAAAGIGNSELLDDGEAVSNWKGGFFMGGMNPSVLTQTFFGVNNIRKQVKANDLILGSTIANRAAENATRVNNQVLVDAVSKGLVNETMTTLNDMQEKDRKRADRSGRLGTDEFWEQKKQNLTLINNLVNDKAFNKQLEAQGIYKNTNEYNIAVADRANLLQQRILNSQERQERSVSLDSLYSQKKYQDRVEQLEGDIASRNIFEDSLAAAEQKLKAIDNYVKANTKEDDTEEVKVAKRAEAEEKYKDYSKTYRDNIQQTRRSNILSFSQAVNRLHALLDLKALMTTLDDWFNFTHDKLGIHTTRPDAKFLSQSIDEQIKQIKEQIANVDEDFKADSNDAVALQYVTDTTDAIGYGDQEILDEEKYQAIYAANDQLIQRQLQAQTDGVVKNGKNYEYNPAEARYERKEQTLQLTLGDKYQKKEHERAKAEDPKNSYLNKRVKQIAEVQANNDALDWFLADTANGDAITNLNEEEFTEQDKLAKEDFKQIDEEYKAAMHVNDTSTPQAKPKEELAEHIKAREQEYQRKKNKAREHYRKKRKARRNKARASFLLGFDELAIQSFNGLIENAKVGFYKFEQFYNDIKEVMEQEGEQGGPKLVAIAKAMYIRHYLTSTRAEKENMNTPLDVQAYGAQVATHASLDIAFEGYKHVLEQQLKRTLVSSYNASIAYTEDGKLHVFVDPDEINRLKVEPNYNEIRSDITSKDKDGVISYLLTNSDRFSNIDFTSIVEEIFKQDNAPELMLGFVYYLTSIDNNKFRSQPLEDSSIIRSLVQQSLLGVDISESAANFAGMQGLNLALQYVDAVKNRMLASGQYRVLNVDAPIYGFDENGNGIQSLADVVLVGNDGQIMIIDVRSSFMPQMEQKMKSGALAYHSAETMMQKAQKKMKTLSSVLYNMFGSNIIGTYVFPFVIDRRANFIAADRIFSIEPLDFCKPVTPYYEKTNQEIAEETVKPLQQRLTELTDELNTVLEQIDALSGEHHEKQEHNIFIEGSNKPELMLLMENISSMIEDIQAQKEEAAERLEQLKVQKKPQQYIEEEYPEDYFNHDVMDDAYQAGLDDVYNTCKRLDVLLSLVTNLRVTTAEERNKINELIYAVYDAQAAIDQFYGSKLFEPGVVQAEQKLIAAAINRLVSNSFIYGDAATKATQWWSTQFASNVGNASYTLFNKIKSYMATFDDEFMNSLVGNRDLQRFWSGVFNNLYKFIVDQAINTKSGNPTMDAALQEVAYDAADFIAGFNIRFPVDPSETEVFDSNSAESINNIDVQWRELYSDTTKHFPAFKAMLNPNYFSIALDPALIYPGQDGKVGNAELVMVGDDVLLKLTDSKGHVIYMTFDQGNDSGPKGVDSRYYARKLKADSTFAQKVRYMYQFMQTHPGYHISLTLSRSKGSIVNGEQLQSVTKFLFAGTLNRHNLYEITCDKNNRIGYLKTTLNINTGEATKNVYGGPELSTVIDGFDREYLKHTARTQSGNIVYFYDTGETEKPVLARCIGVPLISPKFTAGVGGLANKLADLLWYRVNQGLTMYQGYSIDALLKQVLYVKDDTKVLNEKFNSIEGMVTLDPLNKYVYIGNAAYPLNNPQDYTNLYNALCNMYITKDPAFLQQNMSEYIQSSGNTVLNEVKNKFAYDQSLLKVELPNGLTFEREDFMYDNGKGTTGLGYLLRNGYLTTAARKLSPPVVYVDNVELVQNTPSSTASTVAQAVLKQSVEVEQKKAQDSFMDFFHYEMSRTEFENKKRDSAPSFADAVMLWVAKSVGITPEWINEEALSDAPFTAGNVVLAECSANGIRLSNTIPYTIGFHEAFHRALELLVEPSVRELMYEAYRKHNGNLTDREVAEGLADLFVDYMMGTKDAKTIGKQGWIKTIVKRVASRLGMWMKYRSDYSNIAKMFNNVKTGKYANRTATNEAIKRYQEEFKGSLHYEINGKEFKHIATASDKEHMARALAYIIVNSTKDSSEIYKAVNDDSFMPIKYISTKVINSLTGEPGATKPILNGQYMTMNGITYAQRAFREVFHATLNDKGEVVFDNFAAIAPEIKKYLTEIMDAYDGKYAHEDEQEGGELEENDYGKSIERYDRSSFEFNKLDSVSKPVKFMFATIPYYKFDDEGNLTLDLTKNKYGVPTFMPIQQVYNVIVSKLHNVASPTDLLDELKKLSTQHPMYQAVYDKYSRLYNSCYKYDSEGDLRSIDYDKEALMIQVFSAIKGHEHNFIIGRSFRDSAGGIEVKISQSNYDRDAVAYPKLWSSFLTSGLTGIINKVVDRNGMLTLCDKYNSNGREVPMPTLTKRNAFTLIATYLQDLATGLQNETASEVLLNGFPTSVATNTDIERIKDRVCNMLRMVGINYNKDILDNMLSSKYGGVGRNAIAMWLGETGASSINNFINELSNAVQINGVVKKDTLERIFRTGFVSELGNWAGAYLKLTTDKMSNGMDGTKLYNESQNNSITDTVGNLNSNDKENGVIKTVLQSSYNLSSENGNKIGSIVAKSLSNGTAINVTVSTPIGFRSDNRGDNGSKYSNLAEAEDYINKFAMAQAGYCIFPTLADKGTYMVLNGIPIPGMKFSVNKDGVTIANDVPTIEYMFDNGWKPGMPIEDMFYLRPSNTVLDQFIEYAKTEYQAILDCREQLGMHVDNPKGLPLLKDEDKIVNYHVDKKGRPAKGGITFHSFTTLRVPNGKGGINRFSMKELSPDEQIKVVEREFFSKTPEELRTIMALTLQEQTDLEVEKAASLGIISKDGSIYNGLNNTCLNNKQIDAVEKQIYTQIANKLELLTGKPLNAQLAQKAAHSLAIAAILQDVTNRTTIASEECLRLFIGNPGFFKNVEDIQKRIGGLVSTGDDNVTTLPNMDGTTNDMYVCAEVADYEVASQADIMNSLEEKMREGELREIYGNYFGFEKVDELPIGTVRQQLVEEIGEDRVKAIEGRAKAFYDAYTEGINVADGASYITADMCKRMLRARGAYTNDVAKAFEILQGESAYSWLDKRDAYKAIYDKTNLVATKYTAYGFRNHTTNGNSASNLCVPYYNKFALFPIFECLATGPLKGVYNKMKNEGVDNLLMTSAVKVGLQGHVNFNGEIIDKPFNKYTQRFAALRRQLNTDPEEGDVVAAGTQMIKVCLASLRVDRKYGDLTGQLVLDKLMNSINKLSKIGTEKFKNRFFTNGEIDSQKLSEYLIEQLGTRNANKNLIDALTIDPNTGQMKAPIAATSDASWMESMLISAANKDIVNIMTPGSSFIQRSVFGIEDTPGQGTIKGQQIYNGKRLQMINEEGSMDSVISIDYFQDILPKNLSFNEARQWLIDHNIIGEHATANTIGYRIPTQAQSSIHALRFVDVLPAVKSTVILPTEFTKITGSDKLYQCSNQYNIKNRVNCWELHIKRTISSQAL